MEDVVNDFWLHVIYLQISHVPTYGAYAHANSLVHNAGILGVFLQTPVFQFDN